MKKFIGRCDATGNREAIFEVVWINSKDNTVCVKNLKTKTETVASIDDVRFLGFNKLHAILK